MVLFKSLALAAVLVLAAPNGSSTGQRFSWHNYCTVGGPRYCASVELTLAPNGAGGTDVAIRMRNLQGTMGTTPWRMENLGFWGLRSDLPPGIPYFPFPQATLSGTAGFNVEIDPTLCAAAAGEPCPGSRWGRTEWNLLPGSGGFYWSIEVLGGFQGSLTGCVAPATPGNSNGWGSFQTCGDGWVGITATIPGTWTFDEAPSMAWFAYGDQGDLYCSSASSACAQVTPESAAISRP